MEFQGIFGNKEANNQEIHKQFANFKSKLSEVVSLINRARAGIGTKTEHSSGDEPPNSLEIAHNTIDLTAARNELDSLKLEWANLRPRLLTSHSFETIDDSVEMNAVDKDILNAETHLVELENERDALKTAS